MEEDPDMILAFACLEKNGHKCVNINYYFLQTNNGYMDFHQNV